MSGSTSPAAVALWDKSIKINHFLSQSLCLVKLYAGRPDDSLQISTFYKVFRETLNKTHRHAAAARSQEADTEGEEPDTLDETAFSSRWKLRYEEAWSRYRSMIEAKSISPLNEPYEALSYIWGESPKGSKTTIDIRTGDRIVETSVYPSLRDALKALRLPNRDRVFWIDFFCVDQESEVLRHLQLNMFSDIFYQARRVCIWLGRADDTSDLAMEFVKEILNFKRFDSLICDASHRQQWLALNKLIARDWFQRRWIVQEMALARDAVVQCGSKVCSWADFTDALALAQAKWSTISQIITPDAPDEVGDVQPPGALSLVTLSANIFRKNPAGKIIDRRYSLEELLAKLAIFKTTHPLDTIYSIIALASDHDAMKSFPMNYKANVPQTLAAVVKHVASRAGNLDIICRPWAPEIVGQSSKTHDTNPLPSWIRDTRAFPFCRRKDGQYDREYADCLVGDPGLRRYHASWDNKLEPSDIRIDYPGGHLLPELTVRGFVLGKVVTDAGLCPSTTIPHEWQILGGWRDRSKERPPDRFWRTLVADRTSSGDNPPTWYARACEHTFRLVETKSVDIGKLQRMCKSSPHLEEFLLRVHSVTCNRKCFAIDNNLRSVGIGPPGLRVGNIVVIVEGCSVPVVLRQVQSKYRMIGECFLFGLMDGEAFAGLTPEPQNFVLI